MQDTIVAENNGFSILNLYIWFLIRILFYMLMKFDIWNAVNSSVTTV